LEKKKEKKGWIYSQFESTQQKKRADTTGDVALVAKKEKKEN
jgi:hypothetical protein